MDINGYKLKMDQQKIDVFTINTTLLVYNTTNKLKHFPIEIPNIYSICKVGIFFN